MTKLLLPVKEWLCTISLFLMAATIQAQTSTLPQSFTASGYDDDPTEISLSVSGGDFSVAMGQPITSIKILGITVVDAWDGAPYPEEYWCEGDYFRFSLELDGNVEITEQCLSPFNNYLIPAGTDQIRVFTTDYDDYSDELEFTVKFEVTFETPPCSGPINILTSSISDSGATITWDAGTDETSWVVTWGLPGFTAGQELGTETVTATTINIAGLTASTTYEVQIQSTCADDNTITQSYVFNTTCGAVSSGSFCETFEMDSPTANCWTVIDANNDGYVSSWTADNLWYIDLEGDMFYESHNGDGAVGIYGEFSNNDDYLVSPPIQLTGNDVLQFYTIGYFFEDAPNLEVLVSTTGINPADFTQVLMPATAVENEDWELLSVPFNGLTGTVYIAFHIPSDNAEGFFIGIDDICIETCQPKVAQGGSMTICKGEVEGDLSQAVTTDFVGGIWTSTSFNQMIDGASLDVTNIAAGTYQFGFVMTDLCGADTVYATIKIANDNNAGENGLISSCKNQYVNLASAIGTDYQTNGTWYAPNGSVLTNPMIQTGTLGGQFLYRYIVNNGDCPADTATVTVNILACDALGLDDLSNEQIQLFPNPTNNQFTIAGLPLNEEVTIEVIDVQGKVVYNTVTRNQNAFTVDVTNLMDGIYLVRARNASGTFQTRLVKQ